MADLHPEVLKMIEAGPQLVPRSNAMATKLFTHTQESPQQFARRIAALQQELERDACAKIAENAQTRCTDHCTNVAARIRRGKP